ncbi:hypothetical protein ACH5AO_12395 [Streptomyces sp. NPDC018964]|uniref:hypothetical protein n=1 Tax=Streptomyces sp. NPDC018964 TaxID=3365058 RepID=UPI00378F99B9
MLTFGILLAGSGGYALDLPQSAAPEVPERVLRCGLRVGEAELDQERADLVPELWPRGQAGPLVGCAGYRPQEAQRLVSAGFGVSGAAGDLEFPEALQQGGAVEGCLLGLHHEAELAQASCHRGRAAAEVPRAEELACGVPVGDTGDGLRVVAETVQDQLVRPGSPEAVRLEEVVPAQIAELLGRRDDVFVPDVVKPHTAKISRTV